MAVVVAAEEDNFYKEKYTFNGKGKKIYLCFFNITNVTKILHF